MANPGRKKNTDDKPSVTQFGYILDEHFTKLSVGKLVEVTGLPEQQVANAHNKCRVGTVLMRNNRERFDELYDSFIKNRKITL